MKKPQAQPTPPHLSHGALPDGAWKLLPAWIEVVGERALKMHCEACFKGDDCEMCTDLRKQLNNLPAETTP